MITDELIQRINELARKKICHRLSPDVQFEQQKLYRIFHVQHGGGQQG